TGSHAALLVSADDAGTSELCTDSRYELQARDEAPELTLRIATACDQTLLGGASAARIGCEERTVTVAHHRDLLDALPPHATLVGVGPMVETIREVKDTDEIEALRAAGRIAD